MDKDKLFSLHADDPRRLDGYEVVGRLGEGGMGLVFLARAPGGRLVAIKVIRAHLARDAAFRRRFRREVARAQQVPPFCTAEVLDAAPDHDPPYLVVEYVDGPSLEDAVRRSGPLTAANLHAVAANMATALIAIHGAGLIHGDLKPSNVLLAPGSPKVIDFGLARRIDATYPETSARGVVGTVPYMSPERFAPDAGADLSPAADIFAWAGVVVFAGTGRIPFPGDTAVEIAHRIMNDRPTLTGLTGPLRSLVQDAFAKNPRDRPTARQLLDRLIARSGTTHCPYQGLAAYQESDAELFFGRAELTDTLARRLADRLTGTGLMVVLGPSGSGKSSLLRAGLLASLRHDLPAVPGSRSWPRLLLTPGRYPVRELAAGVAELAGIPGGAVEDEILADPRRFPIHLLQALRAVAGRTTSGAVTGDLAPGQRHRPRVILVVDQFEELFTCCEQEKQRQPFINALLAAAGTDEHDQAALVVIGVRADFYARCASYSALAPLLEQNTTVGPMDHKQLRQAIEEPARRTGLTLEPGLVEVLLRDIGADPADQLSTSNGTYPPGALPLLSHALRATWTRRAGQVLSLAAYQATGGVHGAVAASAEAVYDSLDHAGRDAVRRLLLRLVRVDEDAEAIRQRVSIAELTAAGAIGPKGNDRTVQLLDRLATDRLVTVDRETVEITHEALLRAWPRLRTWIAEDRTGLLVRQRLIDAAQAWQRENRDPGGLYRGARLALAREHVHGAHGRGLTPLARAFLAASIAQDRAKQRALHRRAARRVAFTTVLAVLCIVAAGAAVVAVQQRHTITMQQRTATARALAFEAESLRDNDPVGALRLGVAALSVNADTDTRHSLVQTLAANHYAGTLTGVSADLAVTSSGRMALTGGSGHTAVLWDLNNPSTPRRIATLPDEEHGVTKVAMTPDGHTALTADNRTVSVWDLNDPAKPLRTATLDENTGGVGSVALAADGRTALVGAIRQGSVTVWKLSSSARPRPTATLTGNTGAYVSVALSGNGRAALAAGSADQNTLVWDLTNPASPRRAAILTDHAATVSSVALSQDGHVALTGSNSGTALVWELPGDSSRPVAWLAAHTGPVYAVALDGNGTMALTGGRDGTAILWDLRTPAIPRRLTTLTDRTGVVSSVALAAAGQNALTTSDNGTAIVWSVDTVAERRAVSRLTGQGGPVSSIAWRADGRAALTAGGIGEVLVWDLRDPVAPHQVIRLAGHSRGVRSVAWRADGHAVLTGDGAGAVALWDLSVLTAPRRVVTWTGHSGPVWSVAWRADGKAALTTGGAGQVLLWDLSVPDTPRLVTTLTGHSGPVWSVAWRADGKAALTGGADGQVLVWDLHDPARPRRTAALAGHSGEIRSVAWRADGRVALTGDTDGKMAVWDVGSLATPHLVADLAGNIGGVYDVAVSSDGQTALTGGQDGTAVLWDITTPARPARVVTLTDHAAEVLSVGISRDGRTALTGGAEGETVLYDIAYFTEIVRAPVKQACAVVGQGLTRQEWKQHIPGLPYQRTCP